MNSLFCSWIWLIEIGSMVILKVLIWFNGFKDYISLKCIRNSTFLRIHLSFKCINVIAEKILFLELCSSNSLGGVLQNIFVEIYKNYHRKIMLPLIQRCRHKVVL